MQQILVYQIKISICSLGHTFLQDQNRWFWFDDHLDSGITHFPATKKQQSFQSKNQFKRTFISKWRILHEWIKCTPSQICIIYSSQRRSVRIKSSSITRSNNSPPLILKEWRSNLSWDEEKVSMLATIPWWDRCLFLSQKHRRVVEDVDVEVLSWFRSHLIRWCDLVL